MKIKDLSNQNIATLADCESEPIHIPGSIQPHGALLALHADGTIAFCSANIKAVLGAEPAQLLQQPLSACAPQLAQQLSGMLEGDDLPEKPLFWQNPQGNWDLFLYRSDHYLVLELEQHQEAPLHNEDLFDQTSLFVQHIERARTLQELCQRIADQTRNITGYDRVMVYRFDAVFNGEVYAESKTSGLEPFLNLHYPYTDIPVQARELYLRNKMRMIADVTYQPVALLSTDATEGHQLDLSDSVLRSVSPIHIQYLKNMGVAATLTISLILEGRLWGLIACHHYSPKHLSYAQRKAALLQGHFLTSQIKVRQVAEEYSVNLNVEAHLQQLLNTLHQEGDFLIKFKSFTSLLAVTNASGVAILHNGRLYEMGMVPMPEKTKALFQWLSTNVPGLQFSTASLVAHYPEAAKISRQAAGILYHKLGDADRDAIIWFREEREHTIDWAGDPHDTIHRHKVENQLSPRRSFALFREQVRHTSQEWRVSELNAATRFASSLQNQWHVAYLRKEEAQQRLLNEQLQKANKELANINWITTHDLKEPLRKILVFSSRVVTSEESNLSQTIVDSINRIQKSARRMQSLVDDLTAYTLTEDRRAAFEYTNLNDIIRQVLDNFDEELQRNGTKIAVGKLPHVHAIPYQMRQLFTNLLGNALKFARPGIALHLQIDCERISGAQANQPLLHNTRPYYLVTVQDNGIGFNNEEGTKIFDIFFRLNDREAYSGNGMGLAICKRIVENHEGIITASGEKNQGASFQIYLPADNL